MLNMEFSDTFSMQIQNRSKQASVSLTLFSDEGSSEHMKDIQNFRDCLRLDGIYTRSDLVSSLWANVLIHIPSLNQ